jgi:type I site-specific restriction-modification system R (restriction) subunit
MTQKYKKTYYLCHRKTKRIMPEQSLQWFKTEEREGRTYVFDPLRRRQVMLTPEEEVRQKALYLLVEHLRVPAGLVAVEYSLKVNGMDKRADVVVFGKDGRPLMIVECKAPSVTLTEAVLDQAVRYHSALSPSFLLLTNGSSTYCFKAESQGLRSMDHLPDFVEMQGA